MPTLSDKLKSLGVKIGAQSTARRSSSKKIFANDYRHDTPGVALSVNASLAMIADWANEPVLARGSCFTRALPAARAQTPRARPAQTTRR